MIIQYNKLEVLELSMGAIKSRLEQMGLKMHVESIIGLK